MGTEAAVILRLGTTLIVHHGLLHLGPPTTEPWRPTSRMPSGACILLHLPLGWLAHAHRHIRHLGGELLMISERHLATLLHGLTTARLLVVGLAVALVLPTCRGASVTTCWPSATH